MKALRSTYKITPALRIAALEEQLRMAQERGFHSLVAPILQDIADIQAEINSASQNNP